MKVRSSKLRTERDEVDLNSHTSFRDPANLAVVNDGRVAAWYSYQGIHDLPKFFLGKTLWCRVWLSNLAIKPESLSSTQPKFKS